MKRLVDKTNVYSQLVTISRLIFAALVRSLVKAIEANFPVRALECLWRELRHTTTPTHLWDDYHETLHFQTVEIGCICGFVFLPLN